MILSPITVVLFLSNKPSIAREISCVTDLYGLLSFTGSQIKWMTTF